VKIKKIAKKDPKSITLKEVIAELSKDTYEVSTVDLFLLEKNLRNLKK
jgi:hypothetical protein